MGAVRAVQETVADIVCTIHTSRVVTIDDIDQCVTAIECIVTICIDERFFPVFESRIIIVERAIAIGISKCFFTEGPGCDGVQQVTRDVAK